jgi:hypothetical protein
VVYHPGGSLSSHYGVHSKLNEVPIFTKRKPKVGAIYKICKCNPQPRGNEWCPMCDGFCGKVPELDVEEALKGFSQGIVLDIPYERDLNRPELDGNAIKLLLGAIHNVAFFGKKESRLLGVGIALTIRLALCACFGEARHKSHTNLSRDQIYKQAWADVADYVKRFNEARKKFYEKGWRPGFGGKAWAVCADATAELWNLTVKFVRSKRLDDLKTVVESFNKVVNCAHNNGWWFNKFIDQKWFDIAVNYPAAPLIATADIVYDILKETVRVEGLVAEIEKANASETKTVQIRYRNRNYSITQRADGYLFADNLYVNLKDAVFAVVKMKNPTRHRPLTDRFIRRNVSSSPEVIEWIIQEISKEDLARHVTSAQMTLRQATCHIQTVCTGEGKYSTMDKPLTLLELQKVNLWWATAQKTTSLAGGDTVYGLLDVKADGIYAGPLKLVALKNYKGVL